MCFGASQFLLGPLALADFGPLSIAAWRVSLGAVVLLVIALVIGQGFPSKSRDWRNVVIVGCLNSAIPFFLISWGQQFISSAETALLMAMGTFFALIVSHFTSHDERINTARALGVSVGFMGVLVLVFWDISAAGLGALIGQLAVIVAGCSYAASSIVSRRLTHLPMLSTTAATLVSASLYMVPLAFVLENPLPSQVSHVARVGTRILTVVPCTTSSRERVRL